MEALIFGIVGIFFGVVGAWLFLRGQHSTIAAHLTNAFNENTALKTELDAQKNELRSAQERITSLSAELAAEKASAAERQKAHEETLKKTSETFTALSADVLRKNSEDFLSRAQESFAKHQQSATNDLEARQTSIKNLVDPLKEILAKMDTKVGEIEKARAAAYSGLGEQLKALDAAQSTLRSETQKLSTSLRSTSTAGTWGELQLRRVIELSGMKSYCNFTEQNSVTTNAGDRLRPDVVVQLAGGQQIVIDAKSPIDAYREAVTATDDSLRSAKLKEHAAKVRGHIDALGAKNYWEEFQPSPEFVVLFLPGDQFLAGALEADPTLLDRGIDKKVLLASPVTLIALLKAAAYGWKQETFFKNTEEVKEISGEFYERLRVFIEKLEKVGKNLGQATDAYNEAVGSFESKLLPGARKLEKLGAGKGGKLPESALPTIEAMPRDITRRS